eukprot:1659217-Prymnesium_polylepis.1
MLSSVRCEAWRHVCVCAGRCRSRCAIRGACRVGGARATTESVLVVVLGGERLALGVLPDQCVDEKRPVRRCAKKAPPRKKALARAARAARLHSVQGLARSSVTYFS